VELSGRVRGHRGRRGEQEGNREIRGKGDVMGRGGKFLLPWVEPQYLSIISLDIEVLDFNVCTIKPHLNH
jgi:hypothetical protein